MAHLDISALYRELITSEFSFIPSGEYSLQDIYLFVKKEFIKLCDDSILCIDNCSNGNNSPEWQHAVRRALTALNYRESSKLLKGSKRGFWVFDGTNISPLAIDIGESIPTKVAITILRIIRDTQLTRNLKLLHKNSCQICGTSIQISRSRFYSEAHHIQPLSPPHNGPDKAENILILCPNHHAMCDYGSFPLDIDDLIIHPKHLIGEEYIDYHNKYVVVDDPV